MKPDALDLLSIIQKYLSNSVAEQVPDVMRSDIRAAAKSLGDARDELDASFPLLARECDELADMIGAACKAMGETPRSTCEAIAAQSLNGLKGCHTRLSQELGDRILTLQDNGEAPARTALVLIFATLREQAGRRLGWQSVFPPDRLISEVLCATWPKEIR